MLLLLMVYESRSQGFVQRTYHDAAKKNLKEVYLVKDTIRKILHGRYISYYLNGNVESKGQFANNETVGVWEFFFETGKLKMRGILRQNSNYGLWEYYYESGQKSMEGTINGKNREAQWKSYYENGQLKEIGKYLNNKRIGLWNNFYEDGKLKGKIEYTDDFGMFTEYHHSGKILGEGPKLGARYFGHWSFFSEDGVLKTEGDFVNGKKNGEWLNYFPSGKLASKGSYVNDTPDGRWEYFFEDGKVSSVTGYVDGLKDGEWQVFYGDGNLKSSIIFSNGSGDYREYYNNGKIKVTGQYLNERKEGKWEYFYEDGKNEGTCQFLNGRGVYIGYFPDGKLQTKGILEDDTKIGAWEIYESDGKLSGYYRPFYEDQKLGKEIVELTHNRKEKKLSKSVHHYFSSQPNEFRGFIVEGNPFFSFAGSFPIGLELYNQERLGYEFEFIAVRDPFFVEDDKVAVNRIYTRGYSTSLKQKFYNTLSIGMWYFGHEIRFTNVSYLNNIPIRTSAKFLTAEASERRWEWGILLGYRLMRSNRSKGFTVDAFASTDIGYREFQVVPEYKTIFSGLSQSKFLNTYHVGLNLGNVFSFK